ncbi:MAG: hypothetical protein HOK72_05970 [Flavobacteriales bacterium]|nr:hypothetical protein [Flavobacteriales bacterium]
MKSNRYWIIVILLLGTALRLASLESFSLTNDELSIITGVKNCGNLSEVLNKGVKTDGHTAFLAIFVFVIGKLFGWSAIALRLPMVIFGIASIWYSYLIGKKWFNPTIGLALAGMIACLEFSLINSQIVRPYSPGFFFYLSFIYYWSVFLFDRPINKSWIIILVSIFAALAASTHYFCALSVGITGIIGLFYLAKENWKGYLVIGILSLILVSPNWFVLMNQLSGEKSVSWIGYSSPNFIFTHIKYVLNNSFIVLIVCLLPFLVWLTKNKSNRISKFQFLAFLFFILPYLGILIYETLVQPAMQSRYLYFSFPFLLLFFLSFLEDNRISKCLALTIVCITLGSSVFINKTYSTDHFGEFKKIAEDHFQWGQEYNAENTLSVSLINSEKYLNYYFHELDINPPTMVYLNKKLKHQEITRLVDESNKDYFIFSWSSIQTPLELYEIIMQKYPHIEKQNIYYNSAITLFSKKENNTSIFFNQSLDYNNETWKYWVVNRKNLDSKDSIALESLNNERRYSSKFEAPISQLTIDLEDNYIVASVNFESKTEIDPLLVLSLTRGKEKILWRSSHFKDYLSTSESSKVFLCKKLPMHAKPSDVLKVFVWNNTGDEFKITNLAVKIKKQSEIPSSSYFF